MTRCAERCAAWRCSACTRHRWSSPAPGTPAGINVYVVETARRLAARGVEVEVFTRATTGELPPDVELAPGVLVRHVTAGPFEGLGKEDLPGQLCAFAAGVHAGRGRASPRLVRPRALPLLALRARWAGSPPTAGACRWCTRCTRWPGSRTPSSPTVTPPSRRRGRSARRRWSRPPTGWWPTPTRRRASWSSCTAPTRPGARRAARRRPRAVHPRGPGAPPAPRARAAGRTRGCCCSSAGSSRSRRRTCCCAPPPTCSAAARSCARPGRCGARRPERHRHGHPRQLERLAARLGIAAQVRFVPPVDREQLVQWYRSADLVAVPSYNESFGLVAVEAQASGTPVVAAAVGGLPTAVGDGRGRARRRTTRPARGAPRWRPCWTTTHAARRPRRARGPPRLAVRLGAHHRPADGGLRRGAVAARRPAALDRRTPCRPCAPDRRSGRPGAHAEPARVGRPAAMASIPG